MSDAPQAAASPGSRPRHDGWTDERKAEFIAALAATGSVEHACERVGMSVTSAYKLRIREGASFRESWATATRLSYMALRESAMARAIHGTAAPLYSRGEIVGERRVFDERLVMFLLKTRGAQEFAPTRQFVDDEDDADSSYDGTEMNGHACDQMNMVGETFDISSFCVFLPGEEQEEPQVE